VDAASFLAMLVAALAIGPQLPVGAQAHPPVRTAIADGLRFVISNRALAGSFAIDINAMMFGMPRALFAVLSLTVYHAGAGGTGLLYAAIAAGGMLAVLTSGWVAAPLSPARRPASTPRPGPRPADRAARRPSGRG
jgi:hypothetical protein